MAVNLASSYAKKVDERFYLTSLTEQSVHTDFSWEGVNAINVYSIATAAMANYTRSGSARYGTAAELDDTVANYLLTRDRSFTFTIDRGNHIDSQMVRESGKALARQLNEVVTPEIDIYRLTKYAAAATANSGDSAAVVITASNAYSSFLDGGVYLDNNKVPRTGRVAYVRPSFYKFIKLDPSFMKSSEIAQQKLINGQVGEVDGVAIVMVPDSYLPANREFILVHKSAMVAPKKLQDYKTHDNPPGINGWLVEGRIYYDAFVLDSRKKAVYAHKNA
jgi:N4-gp56 family major capsid protein